MRRTKQEQREIDERRRPFGMSVAAVVAKAGGPAALARSLNVSTQTVCAWKKKVPTRHADKVAILAGLPLVVVRPDLGDDGVSQ